ncbi:sigma-70 family RNA polymerase sigma factor [Crossiella sp. S99.2]|nr:MULTISPECIES: sigma-70 family RNA polymerase sigma factor [unclassified Crossiella]MCK2237439.1 sigma-70 family RNA polymerase sigma factor [Crossiella sp. S99.2]MCK2251094.1 sigma-70 family RNA polymerase sigma factor [Crossiella sp. S99.1]
MGEDGDEELEGVLTATISGDRSAMSWLLGWIRPIVVRYCRTRIGRGTDSYAEADEVAQEVCLAVLTSLPAYRSQGRPFLAFLYGIAAHKVADRNRGDAEGQDVAGGSPDLGDEVGGLSENLSTLLGILPPRQREVLILRVVVGMSATDAAAALEMTEKAVRAAQHRALTKLQKAAQAEEIISS